ncbi:hypothetical protein AAHH97_21015 [Mycolicibacterium elephantis]|uniref:hypothetical protein n=1 Tax=Mycolicibacterium elephantis TaxID=81858 RepID=UPI003A841FF0
MGIQFRLGAGDHKPVEDFLARGVAGTTAICLDTKAARYQADAAAAAVEAGLHVFWEPATERLAAEGYGLDRYPLWAGKPYDIDTLATRDVDRRVLVERTIERHPQGTTHFTPPHFYVTNDRSAHLNIDLAERTLLQAGDTPVRAVLTISNQVRSRLTIDLAQEYAAAGVTMVEVRLSPFGGDDESLRKIRSGFAFLDSFRERGIHTTLGLSGNVGETALAIGHADAFSVGLGVLERVDHAGVVARLRREPDPEKDRGGAPGGVYLPRLAATVPRAAAEALLRNTDIRTRIGCRIGTCRHSITGPLDDRRSHYLHARDDEVGALLARPRSWRGAMEVDRLTEAIQLRDRVNEHYLGGSVHELKTRTLHSLIDEIHEQQRKAS